VTFALPCSSAVFTWKFFIANVRQPILGADFLTHHEMLVDCYNKQLLFQREHDNIVPIIGPNPKNHNLFTDTFRIDRPGTSDQKRHHSNSIDSKHQISNTLPPEIESYILGNCRNTIQKNSTPSSKSTTEHQIITPYTQPIRQKRRELAPDRRVLAEKEFLDLERAGVIRRSTSPWASPLHIVQKKMEPSVRAEIIGY